MTNSRYIPAFALAFMLVSCLQQQEFVQDIFVYEPHGEHIAVSELKQYDADSEIKDDIYVQGIVTSSDADGNWSRRVVFQDESGGISILADLGSSNQLYPVGSKVSVQCRGMVPAHVNGIICLAASVSGEGLQKTAAVIDNRRIRNSMFVVEGGEPVEPYPLSLSDLDAESAFKSDCLVVLEDVFFQTSDLPFSNEGGSSEQYRTVYDGQGRSLLMCTSDGATMAGSRLPAGKGSITGILSYPNNTPSIMIRGLDDLDFTSSEPVEVNDPDDRISDLFISEYFSSDGAYYVEVFNAGESYVNLADYAIARDNMADSDFSTALNLPDEQLGPFGMAVFFNSKAAERFSVETTQVWDPLRTNYSALLLDELELDGNAQLALLLSGEVVDILSTTSKFGWSSEKTLVRRPGIKGHSKASDYTRADAGWITKVAGYSYNLGNHRFFDTDPDFDNPAKVESTTILNLRNMPAGLVGSHLSITGRVTSDREAGNVLPERMFIQDDSNRGICVAFRPGQHHRYNPGDEVTVNVYGASLADEGGLLVLDGCFVSRSERTSSPNMMPEPVEASVSQLSNLQSMFVYVKDVQVDDNELGNSWSAHPVLSCDLFGNEFYISTLESADFASSQVSASSGSISGIAAVTSGGYAIMPRNPDDLAALNQDRFVPIVAEPVAVSGLQGIADGTVSEDIRVTVSVISDNRGGNMPGDRIFVQDETGGFLLQLPEGSGPFDFGQTLIVVLKGAEISRDGTFVITPHASTSVVKIGAPDPSFQPVRISPSEIADNLYRLVTISSVEPDEAYRMSTFKGVIRFNAKGMSKALNVVTEPTAEWYDSYLPLATGSITGLIAPDGSGYALRPRFKSDLAELPSRGTRLNGEKVVYFRPSTDPSADLFISETVMGDLDANGNLLASVARNKCNSKFVELFNPTGGDLLLENYRVACIKYNNAVARSDISYYSFPEGLVLNPGRTVVFKYVSSALGTSNTSFMTNTLWPEGYTADASLTSGVSVDTGAVPGVILVLDARDYDKSIANSTKSFPAFDGNDMLVVQKTTDGGNTWTEIDRLFSLPTADGSFTGKVAYPFLSGYMRKAGRLGVASNVTDALSDGYNSKQSNRNLNDFESVQCNPVSGGAANWVPVALGDVSDLGVHTFSIE